METTFEQPKRTQKEARDFLTNHGKDWRGVIFFQLLDELRELRRQLEEYENEEEHF